MYIYRASDSYLMYSGESMNVQRVTKASSYSCKVRAKIVLARSLAARSKEPVFYVYYYILKFAITYMQSLRWH